MIRINIAYRLPKEIESEAIHIATLLGKSKESYFFLDAVTALPHMSIYSPVVTEDKIDKIDKILKIVKEVTKEIQSLYLTVKEISEGQGFVTIEFGLTPDIKKVQDRIIAGIEPFREVSLDEQFINGKDYHMHFSQGSLQSIEKYGSVGIISYHPHVTLFRSKNEIDAQLLKRKVVWSKHRFLARKIGVFVMGEHGVCNELLAEFPLQ